MKKTTQDRLLGDAMLAADSWHKEATQNQIAADYYGNRYTILLSRLPFMFIAGMMTAALGILLMAQAFNVN